MGRRTCGLPDARSQLFVLWCIGVTVQYTETRTVGLICPVNFYTPSANVAQYVMFVPYPSQRNVVGFIHYAGHCRRQHLGFVRRAAIVNYGKYCIEKARSKSW